MQSETRRELKLYTGIQSPLKIRRRLLLLGDLLFFWGFYCFGADSISEEVAVFSPLWFPKGKIFVSLSSCLL